jgi:hypothetical protein
VDKNTGNTPEEQALSDETSETGSAEAGFWG